MVSKGQQGDAGCLFLLGVADKSTWRATLMSIRLWRYFCCQLSCPHMDCNTGPKRKRTWGKHNHVDGQMAGKTAALGENITTNK
eukprot:2769232-Amphidinium_carterae.1